MTRPPAAFYCVADERYFLGAVAMINSLRLNGHREPIYLLDCGLSDEQRELLDAEVTFVEAPSETPPYLLKTVAPLAHPAEIIVLIDVDMIVCPLARRADRDRSRPVGWSRSVTRSSASCRNGATCSASVPADPVPTSALDSSPQAAPSHRV